MTSPAHPGARALAEAALEVARRRAELVRRMREALLRGDDAEALRWARRVAGLDDEGGEDAASDRAHPRQH